MDEFTKVERLVNITGVSYEDAKNALNGCDGNIVDAMVYLESVGKVAINTKSSIDPRFAPISDAEVAAAAIKNEQRAAVTEQRKKGGIGQFFGKILRFLLCNKITISRGTQDLITLPFIVMILAGCISFKVTTIIVILSLFFGIRYTFKKDTGAVALSQ